MDLSNDRESVIEESGESFQDDRESKILAVEKLLARGDLSEAQDILGGLLVRDPHDAEVIFQLANIKAHLGDLTGAVDLLAEIPIDHPEAGLPALGQSADWYFRLERFGEAEKRYQQILASMPNEPLAHRKLAYLYNRQGRRHEAANHIRELCRQGNVRQDELHSLIVLSDAMVSDPGDESAVDYSPLGPSGVARKLFTEQRFVEAADVLRETIESGAAPPSVVAFYGRIVAEAQDDEEFVRWVGMIDDTVREYSEYWSAIAVHLMSRQEHEAAARASLEALDRDPTDFKSINRMHAALQRLGRSEESEIWEQRWWNYKKVLSANNAISDGQATNVDAMDELSTLLFALDRKLEAVMWKSVESYHRQLPREAINHWNLQRRQLVASGDGYPSRSTRLSGMSLDAFPEPDLRSLTNEITTPRTSRQRVSAPKPGSASFRNVAASVGLKHTFRPATKDIENGFRMYQHAGGGVAVLDYDLDGHPDLYFAQGAADPPGFVAVQSNEMYRSVDGVMIDVTTEAQASDFHYTIGCSAGDWNQDGFPDVVTASIGSTRLWINNGDGTFSAKEIASTQSGQRMPASIAIGDLNNDAIPDLFEVNYLLDGRMANPPERNEAGSVLYAVGPSGYAAAIDRIGINDRSGGVELQPISANNSDAHHGFGVVIANLDGKPGNDVFVGNDNSGNQMWVRDQDTNQWVDMAVINGSAFSYGSSATASMGIASGDFDNSGTLDLHITNFQSESACLYLSRDSLFQDRAVAFRLSVPSQSVLGFGSQALDYDNNGTEDLVVTNGHVDDFVTMTGQFRQLPQLFCNLGHQFELSTVDDSSGYWEVGHLGRALARLDFNRDGRTDFVVTHVGEPSALLINDTETTNHWLQVQLVGVQSERDAVGARVQISVGDAVATGWATGGDGYLCRNEQVLSFGLGNASQVDRIEIVWPSGRRQTIENVTVDQRLLIVEDESEAFAFAMKE